MKSMKKVIPIYEFALIFKWADTAQSNKDFWRRLQIASAAYDAVVQINMAKLVALANKGGRKVE